MCKTFLSLLIVLSLAPVNALAYSRARAPSTSTSPSPSPSAVAPSPANGAFVSMGVDASASFQPGGSDYAYGKAAIGYINAAVASGCVAKKVLAFKYSTLERDPAPALLKTDNARALDLYLGGAPYALDVRWYSKRLSKVIGYTYFTRDNAPGAPSETRIWSNLNNLGPDPKEAAEHWAHELSHQARAGGFGHWTRFDGSFPYVMGDIVAECIRAL